MTALADDAHADAAEAYVERALTQYGSGVEELYVFGSTARGEAQGLASDVDVLVVIGDEHDHELADALRDIAYDVMLEHGPVVELHGLSAAVFRAARSRNDPFVWNVVREGHSYA